jgi:membrane protein YdbS with pleckstrin-like domain
MTTQGQKQQLQSKHFPWKRLSIFIIAVLFLVCSTVTGILSFLGATQGAWGSMVSLILGAIGVGLGIYSITFSYASSSLSERSRPPSVMVDW